MIEENGNEHDIHSFALANAIYHAMQGKMVMGRSRGEARPLRGSPLRQRPAVLIEGGFLTNAGDARKVASKQWRDNYAASIARGILEYRSSPSIGSHRVKSPPTGTRMPRRLPVASTTAKPPVVPGVILAKSRSRPSLSLKRTA